MYKYIHSLADLSSTLQLQRFPLPLPAYSSSILLRSSSLLQTPNKNVRYRPPLHFLGPLICRKHKDPFRPQGLFHRLLLGHGFGRLYSKGPTCVWKSPVEERADHCKMTMSCRMTQSLTNRWIVITDSRYLEPQFESWAAGTYKTPFRCIPTLAIRSEEGKVC